MDSFRILIVENDEKFCHAIIAAVGEMKELQQLGRVDPEVAHNREEASAYVRERFYHLAFVDPHLGPDDDADDFSGFEIIRQLSQQRPRCRRFLMTKHLRKMEYVTRVSEMLHPLERVVDGVIVKQDWHVAVEGIVSCEAKAFLGRKIEVKGTHDVFAAFAKNAMWMPAHCEPRFGEPKVAEAEIDDVVSRLFGQADRSGIVPTVDDFASVELMPLPGGLSSAVVRLARPTLSDGRQGIWCVVKTGPIDECREEYARFNRFVRYRIGRERRVDLLGYAEGDLLAGLCMTFVGASASERPESIEDLFRGHDERAVGFLGALFAPDRMDWYNDGHGAMAISEYFDREYHWKGIPRILGIVDDAADDVLAKGNCRRDRDRVSWEDEEISLPSMITGDGVFRERQRTCIVHGDLHGANILVDKASKSNERAILIDYRHVGVGPRCLDFAALELSLRLCCNNRKSPGFSVEYVRSERRVLKEVWGFESRRASSELGEDYWERVSIAIGRLVRQNFADVTIGEYAATCVMWGLRSISIPGWLAEERVRILEWLSEYCCVLGHP